MGKLLLFARVALFVFLVGEVQFSAHASLGDTEALVDEDAKADYDQSEFENSAPYKETQNWEIFFIVVVAVGLIVGFGLLIGLGQEDSSRAAMLAQVNHAMQVARASLAKSDEAAPQAVVSQPQAVAPQAVAPQAVTPQTQVVQAQDPASLVNAFTNFYKVMRQSEASFRTAHKRSVGPQADLLKRNPSVVRGAGGHVAVRNPARG